MTIIPESKIQQEAFNWFTNNYCLPKHEPSYIIHSVPNGIPVKLPPNEMARALDLLNKMGMKKGVSDLIIHLKNGICIWAECKRPGETQSPDQIKLEQKLNKLNGNYFVFHSLEEFQQKIKLYL